MAELNQLLDQAREEVEALSLRAREDRAEVADLARKASERIVALRAVSLKLGLGLRDAKARTVAAGRELAAKAEDAAEGHERVQAGANAAGISIDGLLAHIREGVERLEDHVERSRRELSAAVQSLREEIQGEVEAAHEAREYVEEAARRFAQETAAALAQRLEEVADAVGDGARRAVERIRAYEDRTVAMTTAFVDSAAGAQDGLQARTDEALTALADGSAQAAAEAHEMLTGEVLDKLEHARETVGQAIDELGFELAQGAERGMAALAQMAGIMKMYDDLTSQVIENLRG